MDKLFLGISNHVVCLSKKTGEQLWKTKLKSSTITNVYYETENVFAYSGGCRARKLTSRTAKTAKSHIFNYRKRVSNTETKFPPKLTVVSKQKLGLETT
mgnify:CR=1 FL=1